MDYYIHNLDPVLIHLVGPLAIRWYGLAYLTGFVAAYLLWKNLSRKGLFQVPEADLQNYLVLMAFFGVFLGGRVGYMLFYRLDSWPADPLAVFRVWEGGMASHGGIIGTILFMAWYARRRGYSFLNLTDNAACVVPVGLGLGRLANFINGELWGRVTDVPWAVIFPQELGRVPVPELSRAQVAALVEQGVLHPRHPSQLYEALGEGLLLFVLLWWLRHRPWSQRQGRLSAAFLVVYAVVRISVEFVREPDSAVLFGWITKGQWLSALMIVGAGILVWVAGLTRPAR